MLLNPVAATNYVLLSYGWVYFEIFRKIDYSKQAIQTSLYLDFSTILCSKECIWVVGLVMHTFFPAGYVDNSLELLVYLSPPKSSICVLGVRIIG